MLLQFFGWREDRAAQYEEVLMEEVPHYILNPKYTIMPANRPHACNCYIHWATPPHSCHSSPCFILDIQNFRQAGLLFNHQAVPLHF